MATTPEARSRTYLEDRAVRRGARPRARADRRTAAWRVRRRAEPFGIRQPGGARHSQADQHERGGQASTAHQHVRSHVLGRRHPQRHVQSGHTAGAGGKESAAAHRLSLYVSGGGYIGSWLHGVIKRTQKGQPADAAKTLLTGVLTSNPDRRMRIRLHFSASSATTWRRARGCSPPIRGRSGRSG